MAELFEDGRIRVYVYPDPKALAPTLFLDYASQDSAPETGDCYFVFYDQRGLPSRVEDAEGSAIWRARGEPYGGMHILEGMHFHMPIRFPGHWYDAESGLHYNRFRHYSPELGRYLQPDPRGTGGGLNLYAYTTAPLIQVDVRGLMCDDGSSSGSGDEQKPRRESPDPADVQSIINAAVDDAVQRIPGLNRAQAEVIIGGAFARNSTVVFGGSRVRGNFTAASDLDIGYGNLSASQAERLRQQAARVPGGLPIERTKIVPGNHPPGFTHPISSPEDFFMASGTRTDPGRVGEPFGPSGYVRYGPDGSITTMSPDGTQTVAR